jgi:hypothetical protein
VTAISGACPCTVTIPGSHAELAFAESAAWWSNGLPITGSGAEDLSLDHTSSSAAAGTFIFNGYGIWLRHPQHELPQNTCGCIVGAHDGARQLLLTRSGVRELRDRHHRRRSADREQHFQHIASPMLNEEARARSGL